MKIILYQPQIPQNTGNIARTCAATGTELILVHPLGFSTHSRHLKRAGLDYWDHVSMREIDSLTDYLEMPFFCFSSKAHKWYTEARYPPTAQLVFGSETNGLPPFLWQQWPDHFFTIPMRTGQRCLNLANTVSIVLYEALRQNHFDFAEKSEPKKVSAKLTTNEEARGR